MKWFDIDIFFQDLNSVFWDCVFIYDDINDIWVIWYKLFIEVIDCYVLFKKKLVCGNVVLWMILKIIQVINIRNCFYRRFIKKKIFGNWEIYRK